MQNLSSIINQLNNFKNIHNSLYQKLTSKENIDYTILYRSNDQLFYDLLRCIYNIDTLITEEEKTLTVNERFYLKGLYNYGRTLLERIKFFPKLSYILWQRSLGSFSDLTYLQMFEQNKMSYLQLKKYSDSALSELNSLC